MDRFYQADHGGTVHQRHALAIHRRKAAASIISVQLNPNLGKAFVVQINGEADFFLLCRLFVGKLVRRQLLIAAGGNFIDDLGFADPDIRRDFRFLALPRFFGGFYILRIRADIKDKNY